MAGKTNNNDRIYIKSGSEELSSFHGFEQKTGKKLTIIWILAIILVVLVICSLAFLITYRQFRLDPAYFFGQIKIQMNEFYLYIIGKNPNFGKFVYKFIAVVIVGAGLAATGAALQGSFRNVLAGPSTMGAMSGGSLGALVYLFLFVDTTSNTITGTVVRTFDYEAYLNRSLFDIYGQQICVFIGCIGAVALVLGVSTAAGKGKLSGSTMIICGVVLSSLTSTITMIAMYVMTALGVGEDYTEAMSGIMMGTFDNITTFRDVLLLGIPIIICIALILFVSGRLNVLSLGEEEALTMGVNVTFYKYFMIIVVTIITAVIVSFCGHIGFLGFMVPLVGRKIAGPDMRRLLPVSLLIGAILLVLVYDVAYFTTLTGYMSLFTSSIGSVVMVVTIIRRKGGRAEDGVNQASAARYMGFR